MNNPSNHSEHEYDKVLAFLLSWRGMLMLFGPLVLLAVLWLLILYQALK